MLSETDLSILLNTLEEEFGAIFKILMAQYHVYPSSSVILTKKHTHIEAQYATNMENFYTSSQWLMDTNISAQIVCSSYFSKKLSSARDFM